MHSKILTPKLVDAFRYQASACEALGSPFTAKLCSILAKENSLPDGKLLDVINTWPGDVGPKGDSIPLRLAGALHHLVLTNTDVEWAAIYPPNNSPSGNQLAELLKSVVTRNQNAILDFIASPPQTNETARSAVLLPAFTLLAQYYELPFVLSELGSSAGLNLNWDHYAYDYGSWTAGNNEAKPKFEPQWNGPALNSASITVHERTGCDINPVPIATPDQRLRLQAYVWADQLDRKQRLAEALDVATIHPPQVEKSDALPWLNKRLSHIHPNTLQVIYHSIAWQYFPQETKTIGKQAIFAAGKNATRQSPLAWLQLEADDQQPGALISLSIWDGSTANGRHINLGRADFHGRWINWTACTTLEEAQ